MELKKCPEGHYYDVSVYSECPTCRAQREGNGGTVPLNNAWGGETVGGLGATAPVNNCDGKTMPPYADGITRPPVSDPDGGRTMKVDTAENGGYDPVVGWLVSINGPERGRDYQIHSENNYIGREEKMDICIRGDKTISHVNHALIAYDGREKAYYFAPSTGRSLVRVNGKTVLGMVQLSAYDVIEIGQTKLIFVPLCGEKFDWESIA